MTKTQLIVKVAAHADLDKKTTARVIDALATVIPMAVAAGERVTLPGLGVLEAVHREARTARNPQTGEIITIPAGWVPRFRPSTALKNLVAQRRTPVGA